MANLINAESGSHWYYADGKPCYELPNASKPGETRAVTIKDARKLNLLPSVTTKLKVVAKPQLEAWKQEQAILHSLTTPRPDGISDQDYAKLVVKSMNEDRNDTLDLGIAVHQFCEDFMLNRMPDPVPGLEKVCEKLTYLLPQFIDGRQKLEQSFAYPAGNYAGRIDYVTDFYEPQGEAGYYGLIIDFKTQFVKKDINVYDEWGIQLEAYAQGYDGILDHGFDYANIVISTNSDNPVVEVIRYTQPEKLRFRDMWEGINMLWNADKNYYHV